MKYIPNDADEKEVLKLIADHLYTETEENIQACIESESYRNQVRDRINESHRYLRNDGSFPHIYQLPWH